MISQFRFYSTILVVYQLLARTYQLHLTCHYIDDALDFLRDIGYGNYFVDSLFYVVNRFQHLGHVALLAQNSRSLNEAYESGAFIPYWMDAAPQWLFMKLNGIDIVTINKFIVRYIFYSDNSAYATNPGIAGWFFARTERVGG